MSWPDSYSSAPPGETVLPGELSAQGLEWIAGTPAWNLPPDIYRFGFGRGETFLGDAQNRHAESRTGFYPPNYFVGRVAGKMALGLSCMLDQPLLARIRDMPLDHEQRPYPAIFWREVLAETASAVEPSFSPDALNAYNASLFSNPDLIFNESGYEVSRGLTEEPASNWVLGGLVASAVAPGSTLRLKELASGPRSGRWEPLYGAAHHIGGIQRMEVTVSDLVLPKIPSVALSGDQVRFSAERHNLLEPMPNLPAHARYDVVMGTYTFDSFWHDDLRLTRFGDQWLQTVYRLKVPDTYPRQQEMLRALRSNQPLNGATGKDYFKVYAEEAFIPFDITNHPYAAQLDRFIPDGLPVNVPMGYIKTTLETLENQLTPDGAFIVGEVGIFENDQREVPAFERSGAALYKQDHYGLAQAILREAHGLDVQTYRFPKLANRFLGPDWQRGYSGDIMPTSNHAFIVARRRGARTYSPVARFEPPNSR